MFRRKPRVEKASTKAVSEATTTLRAVQARHHEIRTVSASLRVLRQNNHFAEQLRVIMEGHR